MSEKIVYSVLLSILDYPLSILYHVRTNVPYQQWPRGTGLPQLPSAVTSTVDHPLGSASLSLMAEDRFTPAAQRGD
jgi:hypothetical protein